MVDEEVVWDGTQPIPGTNQVQYKLNSGDDDDDDDGDDDGDVYGDGDDDDDDDGDDNGDDDDDDDDNDDDFKMRVITNPCWD